MKKIFIILSIFSTISLSVSASLSQNCNNFENIQVFGQQSEFEKMNTALGFAYMIGIPGDYDELIADIEKKKALRQEVAKFLLGLPIDSEIEVDITLLPNGREAIEKIFSSADNDSNNFLTEAELSNFFYKDLGYNKMKSNIGAELIVEKFGDSGKVNSDGTKLFLSSLNIYRS